MNNEAQNQNSESSSQPDLKVAPSGRSRRHWKNLFLSPKDQLKTGGLIFAAGFILISLLFGTILASVTDTLDYMVSISADQNSAMDASHSAKQMLWTTYALLLAGFMCSAGFLAVSITNRYLGPMVAIRRQVKALHDGVFSGQINLRNGDEFQDVADQLNALAKQLEAKKTA